jgi:hypothetical protein
MYKLLGLPKEAGVDRTAMISRLKHYLIWQDLRHDVDTLQLGIGTCLDLTYPYLSKFTRKDSRDLSCDNQSNVIQCRFLQNVEPTGRLKKISGRPSELRKECLKHNLSAAGNLARQTAPSVSPGLDQRMWWRISRLTCHNYCNYCAYFGVKIMA